LKKSTDTIVRRVWIFFAGDVHGPIRGRMHGLTGRVLGSVGAGVRVADCRSSLHFRVRKISNVAILTGGG
jgi:hypothetical protein